jgi:predicted lactoylglutathione lyase
MSHRLFVRKPLSDAATSTEAIYAISCDSRQEVDRIADTAAANGGTAA